MIYDVDLKTVGLTTGSLLVVGHSLALLWQKMLRAQLPAFPRSKTAGFILLTIAAAWALYLIRTMDLGEFVNLRSKLTVLIPVAYLLTLFFVQEFLAVRALGMVALLAACVLLDAAFLKPDLTRLALVVLAYAWIVAGMFWVGMPYLLRDQLGWLTAQTARWQIGCVIGVCYGALLAFLALTRWS